MQSANAALMMIATLLLVAGCQSQIEAEEVTRNKCGDLNVLNAAAKKIRLQAKIQNIESLFFESQPIRITAGTYSQQIDSIPINFQDVRTESIGNSMGLMNCLSSIEISIPDDAMDVIAHDGQRAIIARGSRGKYIDGGIYWEEFKFTAEPVDRGDIRITLHDQGYDTPRALKNVAILHADSGRLMQDYLEMERHHFEEAEEELNAYWGEMTSDDRKKQLVSQRKWIEERRVNCGEMNDANYEDKSVKERIQILKCYGGMSRAKLDELMD